MLAGYKELSEETGIPIRTLKDYVKQGKIDVAKRVAHIVLFDRHAVEQAKWARSGYPDELLAGDAAIYLGLSRPQFNAVVKQFGVTPHREEGRAKYYRKRDLEPLKTRPGQRKRRQKGFRAEESG